MFRQKNTEEPQGKGPLQALGMVFAAIYSAASAINQGASALDRLAGIADSEAEGLALRMEAERKADIQLLKQELATIMDTPLDIEQPA